MNFPPIPHEPRNDSKSAIVILFLNVKILQLQDTHYCLSNIEFIHVLLHNRYRQDFLLRTLNRIFFKIQNYNCNLKSIV